MAHHKRKKRKRYVGCCSMCACRNYAGGVPHKRMLTIQELRRPQLYPQE